MTREEAIKILEMGAEFSNHCKELDKLNVFVTGYSGHRIFLKIDSFNEIIEVLNPEIKIDERYTDMYDKVSFNYEILGTNFEVFALSER